jgi:hypothetical protein
LTSTSASSARGRSWGKRRVRRGLRDWSSGAAGRRSVALACEAWRGSLERRNEARLRPVQGLTTEHLGAVQGFWRVFARFRKRRYLPSVGSSVDIALPWTETRRSSDSRKVRPPGRENKVKPCPPALPATVLAGGSCSSTVMLNFGDASFKRRVEVHTAPRVPCGTRIVCAASHIMP